MNIFQNSPAIRETQPRLTDDQRGLTTVEYAIVLVLIAVVGIGVWKTFGTNVATRVTNSANAVQQM